MTYYEGILVTDEGSLNAAAIGAEIDEGSIGSQIYIPSDTARKLEEDAKFTFSLTDEPELFYRAALTGHNEPDISELSSQNLEREEEFFYPKEVTRVYFCRVDRTRIIADEDEYGEAKIKLVEGEIQEKSGSGEYIGRENPLVDAMVHVSRLYVADQEQRIAIKEKVESILEHSGSKVKKKILQFVEGKIDEI